MSENMIRIQKATIHILTRRLEEAVAEVKKLREGINEVLNDCWPNATKMMKKLKEMSEHGE